MDNVQANQSMKTRAIVCLVLLAPNFGVAQIYRCDTPEGPVFSDSKCGSEARQVIMREESRGLGGGPSEEVLAYLEQKRRERAEEREKAPLFTPRDAPAAPAPEGRPTDRVILLPANARPVRPVPRPASPPERPPLDEEIPGDGSTLVRPRPAGQGPQDDN